MKTKCFFLIGAIALVFSGAALAALTTEELTRLKASGLGEDVIRFMIESDYANVDRVVRLKEAGFADETVSSVIRNDLKAGREAKLPAPQPEKPRQAQPVAEAAAIMQTSAKVRIEQYWVHGEPVVQNSQDIQNATISLLRGRRLKIEWDDSKGVSPLGNFFRGKPFASPFYWDLDKSDGLYSVNPKDNSFILRTGYSHGGRPTAGKSHYWIVHFTPQGPDLAKKIRELLPE
jgi:hypothetical protein